MKFGVVIFPGSNCDQDLIHVLQKLTTEKVAELWHKEKDLKGCTHIFLPGGFSYGDYLRSGALAKLSPVMESVISHANQGDFVMGICNGFQILCESGLLPGALLRNSGQNFICKNVFITTQNNLTAITRNLQPNEPLKIPIAHAEGRFFADENTINSLRQNGQIIFQYCDANGNINPEENPNGSMDNIAGITNKNYNVFGMMPHPERAADAILGNTDGLKILESILKKHAQTESV